MLMGNAVILYMGIPIALFALLVLSQPAYGFSVSPLFSGAPLKCTQINASYISCPDGANITITFSVSAPYAPYYGNFTVYPTDFINESMPTNIYGKICSVASSSTVTCFIAIKPISIFYGNGTLSRNITLLLVSESYPQVRFLQSFKIEVVHYQTAFGSMLLSIYYSVNSTYTNMSRVYNYFCGTYSVCNATLANSLYSAGSSIKNTSSLIANSSLQSAYDNLTLANSTLQKSGIIYSSFISNANKISNNIIKARYIIGNATNIYTSNKKILSNCTLANGTSYADYINSSIKLLSSYSMLNTLQSSSAYLNASARMLSNETSLVRSCSYRTSTIALPKVSMPSSPIIIYAAIVIIAIFGIYIISKVREAKMLNEVRSGSPSIPPISTSDSEGSETTNNEAEASTPLASEDSFNKWFDSTIKKHNAAPGEEDQENEAEQQAQQPAPKQDAKPQQKGTKNAKKPKK